MRVLFFTSEHEWSGRARAFAEGAAALAAREHQVTIVCATGGSVERHLDPTRYGIASIDVGRPRLAVAWSLRRVLLDAFAEVVVVHGDRDQIVGALAARWAERAALLRRIEHQESSRLPLGPRLALRVAATGLVFATEEERRQAPVPRRVRVEPAVVPIGIDASIHESVRPAARASLGAAGDARLIVCVANRGGRVRAGNVLRVLRLLAPRHPELRLAFVGAGSDNEDLRMHAAALRLTPLVSFLGERDDVLAVLRAADLAWIAATGDDAAYGCLDAQALRIPVLAERDPITHRYVADGITGTLVPPGEPSEMAAIVARLLAHDDQRAAMGAAGQARVARDFDLPTMTDALDRAIRAAGDRSRW